MREADKLAVEYQKASHSRKSQILKRLWEINAGLIHLMCRPIHSQDWDDFKQIAKTKFVNGVETYKPERGGFHNHIRWKIKSERSKFMSMHYFRSIKDRETGKRVKVPIEKVFSLNEVIAHNPSRSWVVEWIETIKTPQKEYEHNPIEIAEKFLSKQDLEIVKAYYYGLKKTRVRDYGAIGIASKHIGLNRNWFVNRLNKALRTLRTRMEVRTA